MRALALLLVLLPGAAQAEAPYDGYMTGIAACYDTAADARDCIGTGASACFDGAADGQTTVGMMSCLLAEATAWDRLLNAEYARAREAAAAADAIEREYFPEFAHRVDQLQIAQRAWIAFRDAQCGLEYAAWGSGSMRQIAGADCHLRMTAGRTLDLRDFRQQLGDE